MTTHEAPNWHYRLSKLLAVPVTTQNTRFWTGWSEAEGGTATWNALNTTYPLPFNESSPYNSSDVQNYWKPVAGICATALTLIQTDYAHLLGDLQNGGFTAEALVVRNRTPISTWGTNPDTILAVLKTIP